MKILHLPVNIASQISVTVRALRSFGLEARGLAWAHPIQDPAGIECLGSVVPLRRPIRRLLQEVSRWRSVLKAIKWSDVIHWHESWVMPGAWDLAYARRLGKACIVEFWGSDIRIPRIASADNPYVAQMYRDLPHLSLGAEKRSLRKQRSFAKHGSECLIPGTELQAYVDPSLFPSPYRSRARVCLEEFQPVFTDPSNPRPLLIHAPSHRGKKGSDSVLRAVEQLRRTHAFDFRLLQGVQRAEALQLIRSCDIFLDQFVLGDHGLACLESMAFGKPTLCYVKPSVMKQLPPECPIVNATQENLIEVLRELLENGNRRAELGRRSRTYVEMYHDSRQVSLELMAIYRKLGAPRTAATST